MRYNTDMKISKLQTQTTWGKHHKYNTDTSIVNPLSCLQKHLAVKSQMGADLWSQERIQGEGKAEADPGTQSDV